MDQKNHDAPHIDPHSGIATTGHEWDGIRELNTPLPRWWLGIFYATIVWSIGYWVVYPAWPLLTDTTKGVIGYASRADISADMAQLKAQRAVQAAGMTDATPAQIKADPTLFQIAMAQGKAAFGDNCAACHGVGGAGAKGYPNLNDDDWLWGGSLDAIMQTLRHGIRVAGNDETRVSQMPAFGRDGMLKRDEINAVANHVRELAGLSTEPKANLALGRKLFADNCAACHGEAGKGNAEMGAPNLTDAISLYGMDMASLTETIANSRNGVMPAWGGRLDETTLKALTVYVHSLGEGSSVSTAGADPDDMPLFAASAKVYPQSVSGPFRRAKWLILFLCLGIYYLLPFLRWDRGPHLPNQAVLADIANGRFYFFFIEIWPQEVYYFTGLLIIASFALFLMNALAGRVWCGYLCPQTVWTDLFLAVERFFEGDRRERMRLDEAPWSADKLWRKSAKHAVWLVIAWWTGGAWVLYFADAPTLVRELATFTAPLSAYVWIAILTFTTYALAGIMREQVCKFMCPWPRIQAALTDDEALNVTYRYDRGEPRVSVKQGLKLKAQGAPAGDCIDCHQCVAVCPVGIDIRDGAQLDCIQCGLCIDACDTVMAKVGRPKRLIAYDTETNVKRRMAGLKAIYRPFRARTAIYAALILVVGGAMLWQLATRRTADISVLHERAPLFVTLSDGSIRNAYVVRLLNKRPETRPFALTVDGLPGIRIEAVGVAPTADVRPVVTVDPDASREVRVLVTVPAGVPLEASQAITITASDLFAGETVRAADHFMAPGAKP